MKRRIKMKSVKNINIKSLSLKCKLLFYRYQFTHHRSSLAKPQFCNHHCTTVSYYQIHSRLPRGSANTQMSFTHISRCFEQNFRYYLPLLNFYFLHSGEMVCGRDRNTKALGWQLLRFIIIPYALEKST